MRGSVTARAVNAARQMGGRICDLPPHQLDLVAWEVRNAQVFVLDRDLARLLVSGRFAPSCNPFLARVTPANLEVFYRALNRNVQRYKVRRVEASHPGPSNGRCGDDSDSPL